MAKQVTEPATHYYYTAEEGTKTAEQAFLEVSRWPYNDALSMAAKTAGNEHQRSGRGVGLRMRMAERESCTPPAVKAQSKRARLQNLTHMPSSGARVGCISQA